MEQDAPTQAEEERQNPVKPSPRRLGAGLAGVASLALAGSIVLLPGFGLFIAPIALLPVLQQIPAGRSTSAAWGWVVAGLVLILLAGGGTIWAVVLGAYVFVVVLPALSIEAWLRFDWSQARWLAVSAAMATVISLGVVAVLVQPADPVSGTAAAIQEPFDDLAEMSGSAGVSKVDLYRELDRLEVGLKWIAPSFPVSYLILVLFWARPRLDILGLKLPTVAFEEFSNDEFLPWAFAIAGMGTLALGGTFRWVAINLLMTVVILYFAQGLAIIRAHLARWIGRGWLVRWGLGLLCLQMPIAVLVAALGIVDSFYRLRPQPDNGGGNP